jgi:hypothetical protein
LRINDEVEMTVYMCRAKVWTLSHNELPK